MSITQTLLRRGDLMALKMVAIRDLRIFKIRNFNCQYGSGKYLYHHAKFHRID